MYHDNMREAVKMAKVEGVICKPLILMNYLHFRRNDLLGRMILACKKLAARYLINANR